MPKLREMNIDWWEQWIIRQLVSEGITNILTEEELKARSAGNYQVDLDYALKSLMDKTIITQLHTGKVKRYAINIDKTDDARNISRKQIPKEKLDVVQPYMEEPKGYQYWFEPEKRRKFRKQSMYRIYRKSNGESDFVGQVLSQTMTSPNNIHTGSLANEKSHISILVRAMKDLVKTNDKGVFTLQDLQDKERLSVGNNRQRGKVVILVCEKLEIIEFAGMKGNSASYRIKNDNQSSSVNLDSFRPKQDPSNNFNDPETFEADNLVEESGSKSNSESLNFLDRQGLIE